MSNGAQHHILFVDDDADFLRTLHDLYEMMSEHSWEIYSARSADQALEILDSKRIDLVVVDVNMPVIDGIQFIGILQRRHPKLKRAVLTGLATPEKRAASLANGADLFIEKAATPEGHKAIFAMLGELLQWAPREGFQGILRKVGLQDVIQMECLARNSSILEIYNQYVLGRIYIEDGYLIHAVGGELKGEQALYKLLSLPGGSFELAAFEPPPEKTLNGQWEMLLMEAARVRDETAALGEAEGTKTDTPTPPKTSSRLEGTLVCTRTGDMLFDAIGDEGPAHVSWLKSIEQQAMQLSQVIPLGGFDRLETQLVDGRIIVLTRSNKLIFVRVSTTVGSK
ncbi:MAG TPA: response regulator [Verrucomicrobiae bacterium]|nr:response regulator [Verrucomicrobiae bacterium]